MTKQPLMALAQPILRGSGDKEDGGEGADHGLALSQMLWFSPGLRVPFLLSSAPNDSNG